MTIAAGCTSISMRETQGCWQRCVSTMTGLEVADTKCWCPILAHALFSCRFHAVTHKTCGCAFDPELRPGGPGYKLRDTIMEG